jgi:hypothetical protein
MFEKITDFWQESKFDIQKMLSKSFWQGQNYNLFKQERIDKLDKIYQSFSKLFGDKEFSFSYREEIYNGDMDDDIDYEETVK